MLPALSQDTRDTVVTISLERSEPGVDIRSVSGVRESAKVSPEIGQ
jgi:hypothetical protein